MSNIEKFAPEIEELLSRMEKDVLEWEERFGLYCDLEVHFMKDDDDNHYASNWQGQWNCRRIVNPIEKESAFLHAFEAAMKPECGLNLESYKQMVALGDLLLGDDYIWNQLKGITEFHLPSGKIAIPNKTG